MRPNKFTLAVLAAIILASCSKKDSSTATTTPTTNSNTLNAMEKNVVGTWAIESEITYNYVSGNSDTGKVNQLSDCEKDNTFTFLADKTYTEDDGAIQCSSASTKAFGWSIDPTDSSFKFIGITTLTSNYPKILQLDNSKMVFIFYLSNYNYGSYSTGSYELCVLNKIK